MPRGGARKGAGRPSGQGLYGEPTKALRVPVSLIGKIKNSLETGSFQMPLYSSKVAAGFPSPADDFIEARLDANDLILDNPAASYFLRVIGDSMCEAGILPDDYIVVDRSLEAGPGDIVVAEINGEFTIKQFDRDRHGRVLLLPANSSYKPIVVDSEDELRLFGVVSGLVRRFDKKLKK